MIKVIVKGEPVAKGRPRFTRSGHAYTPARTARHEGLIRAAYAEQCGVLLEGPIEAEYEFVYEPPKSLSKKRRSALIGQPKMTKPDTDNLIKLCQDALNGIAYNDDNQIYKITSQKIYGEEAMTIIRLRNNS